MTTLEAPLTGTQRRAYRRASASSQVSNFLKSIKERGENLEAVRLMLRERAKKDFWFFQYHVYGNKDTLTPLHQDMCFRWQKRSKEKFSLWLVPRFHLKTSCWTEAGALWEEVNDCNLRILVVNAKLENAIDILANIRNCVETNEVFRWLFPEFCPDLAPKALRNRCKWIQDRLDFPCSSRAGKREGNLQAMGVEASLVSKHYDLFLYDDPVNDINTATKDYRDKIERWYRNSLQLRHDLTTSRIRLIGTRWHFDDLYSRILKGEYARRKRLKDEGQSVIPRYWIYHRQIVESVEIGGETIAGYKGVQPIWPERFNKEGIDELKEENGSYIFSCQFMNDPVSDDDAVFAYSDIKIVDEYDIPENLVYFIACDTAIDEVEAGDWWVITAAGFDAEGRMYVREIVRDKLLTSSFLEHVNRMTKKWKPVRVGIEAVAYQKTVLKNYKQLAASKGYNIPWSELQRTKASKRKRILAFQPRVERGDFYIEENIPNIEWAIEELTTFPRPVHDDCLDTFADLEVMFFAAPQLAGELEPQDTYNAVYGLLEDDDEADESMACAILNEVA